MPPHVREAWDNTCFWRDPCPQKKQGVVRAMVGRKIGEELWAPPEALVIGDDYERIASFLSDIASRSRTKGWMSTTDYFVFKERQHNRFIAELLIAKLLTLAEDMRDYGYRHDPTNIRSFIRVLRHGKWLIRLDGTHRAAVARYLRIPKVPVYEVTTKELLKVPRQMCRKKKCSKMDKFVRALG